jgi:hypothetical protein
VEMHLFEAVLEEAIANVVRELHVALRPRGVRLLGQVQEVSAETLGGGKGEEEALGLEPAAPSGRNQENALREAENEGCFYRRPRLSRIRP